MKAPLLPLDPNEIRRRWDAGETCKQIGIAVHRTRRQIADYTKRLDLTPRPNPIIRTGPSKGPPVPRAPRITLPQAYAAPEAVPEPTRRDEDCACAWPSPGYPLRFECLKQSARGSSYCTAHQSQASGRRRPFSGVRRANSPNKITPKDATA